MKLVDSGRLDKLEQFVRRHYTPYAYVSHFNAHSSEASLGIQIQEIIPDRSTKGSTIRIVELDDIVSCRWQVSQHHLKVSGLTRAYFARQVKRQYLNILQRSQNALLPSLYTKLVHIPQVSHAMSPLEKIVTKIHENSRISLDDFHRQGEKLNTVKNYFTLLSDLDMIQQENGHYVSGSRMKILEGQIESEELYATILGEVLQKRLKYMREVLHWTMLGSYLQWSNAYYFPAYEANRLIETERQDLINVYRRLYKEGFAIDETFQLRKITNAHILYEKDRYYIGDEEIFNGFTKTANREKILEPVPIQMIPN